MATNGLNRYFKMGLTLICSKLLTIIKLSWVVGSYSIMFSASNLCLPLVGLFGKAWGATAIWSILLGARILTGTFSLATLAFYLPGYCAALYLANTNLLLRCSIPFACISLFLIHPIGSEAALYSAYWIIPIMIALFKSRSLYAQALGATFTAHAVGSVIWLYTMPMAQEAWLALIPQVALERCTFAAGIVVAYHVVNALSKIGRTVQKRFLQLSYAIR